MSYKDGICVTFDDGEWMLLRNRIKSYPPGKHLLYADEVAAILRRLEAAERMCAEHTGHDDDCDSINNDGEGCTCGYEADWRDWGLAGGAAGADRD